MTIIEAVLEKAKLNARLEAGAAAAGPAVSETSARSRRATDRAPANLPPPSTQIQPRQVQFDPYRARENRLLLTSSHPEDRAALSAYGMLRTRILHRMRSKGWQTLGITSAAPSDGKSLTAVNLALSLAREKNSMIVLLDLDMRNPSICKTMGITPPVELRRFFENEIETPQELFMTIGVANLLIAGNVVATENSAELLASKRLEELLTYIKQSTIQPLIVIDLPPVLNPADTLVVAPRVDAFVVVASQDVTPRADLQRAGELLGEFPIAGFVLNQFVGTGPAYDYGYGYGSRGESA